MRRYLKFSVDEVRALPWWQHEIYVRGLVDDLTDPDERPAPALPGTAASLAEQGFTVRGA